MAARGISGMISINVTETSIKTLREGNFVISAGDDVIGYVYEILTGEHDTYVRIDWLDGAKTEHRHSDILSGHDPITVILHPSLLPHWAR